MHAPGRCGPAFPVEGIFPKDSNVGERAVGGPAARRTSGQADPGAAAGQPPDGPPARTTSMGGQRSTRSLRGGRDPGRRRCPREAVGEGGWPNWNAAPRADRSPGPTAAGRARRGGPDRLGPQITGAGADMVGRPRAAPPPPSSRTSPRPRAGHRTVAAKGENGRRTARRTRRSRCARDAVRSPRPDALPRFLPIAARCRRSSASSSSSRSPSPSAPAWWS